MRQRLLFFLIVILAFLLRFFNLGSYPALNADEAALGYNAYSLIKTGKDEHGNSWPIHFQSFNDYKPGLYVYLAIPFVWVLGLNELSVRLPGALAGVGAVIVFYQLTKLIFVSPKKFSIFGLHFSLPEISAFLLAISPWHIHFSRGAWEVNVATFFILLGLLFFFMSVSSYNYADKDKPKLGSRLLTLSFLFFVFSLYTYHAARIVTPLLILGLVVLYRKNLFLYWEKLFVPIVVSIAIISPLAVDLFGTAGFARASGVSIFADLGPISRVNEQRGEHVSHDSFWAVAIHNKYINYSLAFLENYFDHFHGEFLFLSGDSIQRNKVPETGLLYGFEFLFILIGFWQVIKAKNEFNYQIMKVIFWWLLISPIAAAFTFQSPHALRAQNMIIPLTVLSSLGLFSIASFIREQKYKLFFFALCLLLIFVLFWSVFRYIHMYYRHMSYEYPYSSQYGMKELVDYLKNNYTDKKIIVTTFYDQPYILFLFYLRYDPYAFQNNHVLTSRDSFGFSTVPSFDRFTFERIDFYKTAAKYPGSIIIGSPDEIPVEANIVGRIYGQNNFLYFLVVAN